ncbi:CoA transferase [Sphingomonas sp. G-3-2-10]|uniref:CaiB/BaiF CoA transferase family protein n=1 Tax=Sphingomonas sp. G-3-2-10 TaxID=2728838 RepID=UPI00146B0E68|nr:CoA transferase [Sphingomonas sp. G-3-2-10]NML04349.1 CoA transferase [Sphingomonas sp. G-3-2-10]
MTQALEGVKIADFSWVGAGPRATKDLADHGAVVVKVESAKRLDLGRMSPPFKDGKRNPDGSAFFAITNTSKLGVTINLADPRGVEIAKRLTDWADVVVENFGKGFMERLGLDYATLSAKRPEIIMLSVSVAGRTGPMSDLRGYGNSAAALSGLAALSGWPETPPHMPPFAYGDVIAPMFATMGVLAALEHRRVTGVGRHIDVSQVEPLVHILGDVLVQEQLSPSPKRGNESPTIRQGVYPARGHDQWVAVAIRDDTDAAALAQLTGGTDLAGWTATQDKHAVADRLAAAGIPAEAVFDGRDVFTDPELAEGGHYVRIDDKVLGSCEMPAPPTHFSRSEIKVTPPPKLGEHNAHVFEGFLGMSADEVASLAAEGVLA